MKSKTSKTRTTGGFGGDRMVPEVITMRKYSRSNSLCVLSEKTRALFMPSACPPAVNRRRGAASGPKPNPQPKPQHTWPEDWAGSINFLNTEEFQTAISERKCPLETCMKAYRWPFRSSVITVLDKVLENREAREYAMKTPAYTALLQVGMDLCGGSVKDLAKEIVSCQREYKYTGNFKWVSKRGIDMAIDGLVRSSRWFYVKGRGVPNACRRRFVLLILHMYYYTAAFTAV